MITIVLPAFNEGEALSPLLESIRRVQIEQFSRTRVIVVDDGSTDRTAEVVRSYEWAELLQHPSNKGLSEAIKTGLLCALSTADGSDIIVTMDADNTHSPGLIRRMSMLIGEGNDVVIASRYVPGARVIGLSARRRLYSFVASFLFRLLLPIPGVKDYTCGYRAYRASVLQGAFQIWGNDFISMSGFSCMVDILLKLRELDAIVTEVPLILRYDLKPGKSKMNVPSTIGETLTLMWRTRLRQGQRRTLLPQVENKAKK